MTNSWAKLVRLLPGVESTVGKILTISGKNAVVEAIGSGTFIAQTGSVTCTSGDWVLIKDNIIELVLPVPTLVGDAAKDISIT